MREIIKRGTSTEEVIEEFKRGCNVSDNELNYVIEHKGSKGFLSLFGKKEAVVRFMIPDAQDLIKKYLKELLKHLDIQYKDIVIEVDKNTYRTHVKGVDNPGFLIGKEGKMLASIQILLNKVIDDKEHKSDNVILDIDNYKSRYSGSSERQTTNNPAKKQNPRVRSASKVSPKQAQRKPSSNRPRRPKKV